MSGVIRPSRPEAVDNPDTRAGNVAGRFGS